MNAHQDAVGYHHCECRDCFETVVGRKLCDDCLFAGCGDREKQGECLRTGAYLPADEEECPWVNVLP